MFGSYVNLTTAHNKGSSFQNRYQQKLSKIKCRPAEYRISEYQPVKSVSRDLPDVTDFEDLL